MTQTASEETLSSIGNTPLVKLDSLSGSAGDFYAKLEGHNPFGSVKDRAAYWMIKATAKTCICSISIFVRKQNNPTASSFLAFSDITVKINPYLY